jgi:UDP-N-acetylmuramoyl-tripeptide--D-alanyl-D-alanine ligase
MKKIAKSIIAGILGWQVRRLTKKNDFKVIAVVGSIGKTSTKLAVAHILSQKFITRYQEGNYNDIVSVPLIFFDRSLPSIFNPLAWLSIFIRNEATLSRKYPYEVVIVELGTDAPGQIIKFKRYINSEISILTSITPEHMANFNDIDAVANEELAVTKFSKQLLANKDLVDVKYFASVTIPLATYAIKNPADYELRNIKFGGDDASFELFKNAEQILKSEHNHITEPQLYSVSAAAVIGHILEVEPSLIDKGIRSLPSVNGRMQHLRGINNSTIIDDSYNASPEAVRAALDTLYRISATQKIAVLGNMNELGKFSEEEHTKIGEYCDPKQLDLLITIGPDANKYLAEAAKVKGCEVVSFDDPYSAGEYLQKAIKHSAVILVKGSQNKVFAEETTKLILANPADTSKLVRQSADWQKTKRNNFNR